MESRSAADGANAWRAGAALALLVALVHARAIFCGYIWDDDDYVTRNETLRTAAGLARIWFEPGATPQYYPLTFTTFWLEYRLWGLEPLGYHAVNVALHAANAVLVWRILSLLCVPGAWLAAAAFGVHPVHVESVAWITERKNVLSGFLSLASLLWYVDVARLRADADSASDAATAPRGGRLAYGLSLALFVGALLSKTIVCSLPAVILLLAWWRRGRIAGSDVVPLVPFFAVGLALALNTAWMERAHVGAEGEVFRWSFAQRLLIAGPAVWFYFGKIVWPYPLEFMYERWSLDVAGPLWAFPIGALAALVVAWLGRERWGRGPLVGLLYFYGTLFPALGFFNVYPMRYSFVADHFQYLPSLGPIVLIAAGLTLALRPREAPAAPRRDRSKRGARMSEAAPETPPSFAFDRLRIVGAVWLAILSALTVRQIPVYENAETLWTHVLEHHPNCFPAWVRLGMWEAERGRHAEAAARFEEALRLRTDDEETHELYVHLGNALMGLRDFATAERCFRRALEYRADDPLAFNSLGVALGSQNRTAEAIETLRAGLARHPDNASLHYNLGLAHDVSGDLPAAERAYRDALARDPRSINAHYNLGGVLERLGRPSEAAAEYRALLALDPTHARAAERLKRLETDGRMR